MTLVCENNAQKLRYKNPVFVDAEILEYHDCDVKADARFHLNAPIKSSGLPLRSLPIFTHPIGCAAKVVLPLLAAMKTNRESA
ncbi:hypothetical protein PVW51_20615 [Sulfitobacter sp. PR48]|nr:hypothetical protein [Sulfitobacter sp. PR48]